MVAYDGEPARYLLRLGSLNVARTNPYGGANLTLNDALFGQNPFSVGGSVNIEDGVWHQIVVTSDGPSTPTNLYVDGHWSASTTRAWTLGDTLEIGGSARDYDDAALFDKALTPSTIRDLFVTGISAKRCTNVQPATTASPVGVWPIEAGRVAVDTVGCKNGAIGSTPTFVAGQTPGSTTEQGVVTNGQAIRMEVGGAVVSGGPVTVTFWSKTLPGGVRNGMLATLGRRCLMDCVSRRFLFRLENTYDYDQIFRTRS